MRKKWRRLWLDFLVTTQKKLLSLRKSVSMLFKETKPFLKIKYWPLYLLAFSIGFYLWGPFHGLAQVRGWYQQKFGQAAAPTVESLQKEVKRLKARLNKEQGIQTGTVFNPATFSRPALGEIIRGFEWQTIANSWRLHTGVDIAVPVGSNILAVAPGTVSELNKNQWGSFTVKIDHGDQWISCYEGLVTIAVQPGQAVIKGMILGSSGALACSPQEYGFHFGIYHNGAALNPGNIITGLAK